MAEAKQKAAERELEFKKEMQRAAKEEQEILEKRNQAYHEGKIRMLLEQGRDAFERTEYEKARSIAEAILKLDPGHVLARKLRDYAATAERQKLEMRLFEDDVEEMKRLIEGVYEAAIPYQAIFSFPSDEQWAAVEKRAVELQEFFERKGHIESPEEARIKQTLANRKVTINFPPPGVSFEDALNFLREITGLNYYVAPGAAEALSSEDVKINLRLRDIKLENALQLILAQAKDLIYRVKNDSVVINTKDAEKEDLYLRFYEVSDIVNDMPDNPAPKLALEDTSKKGGGQGGSTAVLNLTDEGEKTGGGGINADKLKELIEQRIGEGEGDVKFLSGLLMVRKSLSAHKKIEKLLEALRRTVGVMVTVETRMVDVQDNFLEEIGIDFRGLPAIIANALGPGVAVPGRTNNKNIGYNWTSKDQDTDIRGVVENIFSNPLGSVAGTPFRLSSVGGAAFMYNVLEDFQLQAILEAVKKKQKAREVNAPRVTVFNGQKSHVLDVGQSAYIADIEVNQTGITPTLQPVMGILTSGSILEARPIVSHDRRFVTLEINPQLAKNLTSPSDSSRLRLAQNNTDITVELPVLSLSEIHSTVMVPDGGTIILGGLKNFLEQDQWSGIPILQHVPLLHNLFERKGWTDMKRSLIVLLKVDVTIAREQDARLHNKQPLPSSELR
jgi:general secretion pathway protein D